MKRSITRWTTTLATAALLGVPAAGMAQTPAPQQPPAQQQQPPAQQPPAEQPPAQQPPAQQPPPAEQPPAQPPAEPPAQTPPTTQPPAQQPPAEQPPMTPTPTPAPQSPTMSQGNSEPTVSPQEHLRQAKAALDSIPAAAVSGRARTQLAELKRHMAALDHASSAASPAGSASAPRGASGRVAANAAVNWGTEVAAIDKILGELTAGDTATGTGSMTGTTGSGSTKPTGTAGSKAAAAVAIDDATRAKLMEVRTHIVGYATGMSAPAAAPKGAEANMAGDAPSAIAAATPSTAATLDPRSNATGSPAAQTTTAANASQPAAAAPHVDQDVVRRHLTAARDTLAEITKLPAAAQLQGENRAQVSQLIANFNELITTQSNWSASYAKVDANLNALLGAGATDAAAATPSPAPTSPDPAATPGAVGTSGTAKADLDPAIRAKLVELRRNLDEFHKAAGPAK